ncbi:hypothetical protein ENBRE01_2963 [Enteropsectra breve]|nr:hypothetical protein ENBRE01_2963 [Enteropsectra breve]
MAPYETLEKASNLKMTIKYANANIILLDLYLKAKNISNERMKLEFIYSTSDYEIVDWMRKQKELPNTWRKFKGRLMKFINDNKFKEQVINRKKQMKIYQIGLGDFLNYSLT